MSDVKLSKGARELVASLAKRLQETPTRTADRAIGTADFISRELSKGSEVIIKRANGSMTKVTGL